MSESDSEKTEEATPERRKKARDDGQFPRARDTGAVAATVGILLLVFGLGGDYWQMLMAFCRRCFGESLTLSGAGIGYVGRELVSIAMIGMLPVAFVAAVSGTMAGVAEAGFHPKIELAMPKFERLNPIGKLGQLFSPKSAFVSTLLSMLRVGVVAVVAYWVLSAEFAMLTRLSRTTVPAASAAVFELVMRLAMWSTLSLAVLSVVDYAQSWFKHENQIKMSLQEIKEEMKQQEGSPQIKQRQRARARELAKRGIRKGVQEATVIVTNPTHVAVALRYKAAEGAPVVTAKGYDDVASHIRKLAKEYDVPIVENKPLARALAGQVKVGKVIPMELYVAVAEVLAFVYKLRQRRGVRA